MAVATDTLERAVLAALAEDIGAGDVTTEATVPDDAVGTPGVPLCARAGSVAFIHVLVVHRAGRNATDRNRSAIINEYKTHEALDRWGNPCAFADLPLRRNRRSV